MNCLRTAAKLILLIPFLLSGCMASAPGKQAETALSHRYRQSGNGAPVVVFEAGLGDTSDVWSQVLSEVNKFATTFAYNRAGYAGSRKSTQPRDAEHVVAELRELLQSRRLQPPYVLVGHSLGGLYMQYYARNFPDEVAALVLVDSTHWAQTQRMRQVTPAAAKLVETLSNTMPGAAPQEFDALDATEKQVQGSPPLEQMPLFVISAGQRIPPAQPLRALLEAPFAKHLDAMQIELAQQLPSAKHIIGERSDHYVQRRQPELVVSAIREACSTVRF